MSVEDAKRAIDIGCTAIMISNHGGSQLDGSRSPFDQVKAISDAVGDKLEIILDGGVRRGTHVLKALAAGAKACSFGKCFCSLWPQVVSKALNIYYKICMMKLKEIWY